MTARAIACYWWYRDTPAEKPGVSAREIALIESGARPAGMLVAAALLFTAIDPTDQLFARRSHRGAAHPRLSGPPWQAILEDTTTDLARLERSDAAMGSWFAVVLHGPDRALLEAAADAGFAEVHRIEGLLSLFRPTSEWSALNRDAAARPVRVSEGLFSLLGSCLEYGWLSEGAFDITVGPLMTLWGFRRGAFTRPRSRAIAAALKRVGHHHLRLEPADRTVRFLTRGVAIDPGGIGKGYAVDRMVAVLSEHGVDTAFVSAGGSTIYGLGAPPAAPAGWRVAISAPADLKRTIAEVHLRNASISTSGSYERFFEADGVTFSHIIDPRTGYPARGTSSVSVVAARAVDSEAWTKPYFINGRAWTVARRRPDHRVFFCDDAPDVTCEWIE